MCNLITIRKKKLLDYCESLSNILMDITEDKEIHLINHCQILKRKELLEDAYILKLIELRDSTNVLEYKMCCNFLIDNKKEENLILNSLDFSTRKMLKKYLISLYF